MSIKQLQAMAEEGPDFGVSTGRFQVDLWRCRKPDLSAAGGTEDARMVTRARIRYARWDPVLERTEVETLRCDAEDLRSLARALERVDANTRAPNGIAWPQAQQQDMPGVARK